MEEKKEKKKINKKALLVLFTLAIVFAIIGFIDIKSNAAELSLYDMEFYYVGEKYDSSGNLLDDDTFISNHHILSSSSPIDVYFYRPSDDYSYVGDCSLFAFAVSQSEFYEDGTFIGSSGSVSINGNIFYYISFGYTSTFSDSLSYEYYVFKNANKLYRLNNSSYISNFSSFANDLKNGTLDFTQQIDYDSLEIDESIDVVNNLKVNKLNDSKFYKNQVVYDYLTWSNTENMKLQVQFQPVVKIYKNSKHETYLREYSGEWFDSELLDVGAQSFLCGMDVIGTTIDKDSLVNVDSWEFFSNIYGNADYYDWSGFNAESPEFCYRYRVRYIDTDNLMAGRWVYVSPSKQYEQYEAFIEEIDDSQNIVNGSLGGSKIDIDDIGIDAGIESIENENAFKDKYEIIDGDADTQEVMNWLNTVVSFIKGTPDLVTEVLSFLPQPILYGMYITIFLGVIASAIAIIKALI